MKKFFLCLLLTISFGSKAQLIEGTELGFDGFFSASTQGGAFGIGPKFGFLMNENLIIGPSFRFQRTWSNNLNTGLNYSYNNYGGGFFLHGRYKNTLFGGFEFEVMKNKNVLIDTSAVFKNVVPTLFVCAGFSREFKGIVRLNVGLYYDVINSINSPFRKGYILPIKNAQSGAIQGYVPLIYRISFFFPLTRTDKSKKEEEVIEEELEETW
jgi:hypothetical protein